MKVTDKLSIREWTDREARSVSAFRANHPEFAGAPADVVEQFADTYDAADDTDDEECA